VEEAVTRVVRVERILGQSSGRGMTSTVKCRRKKTHKAGLFRPEEEQGRKEWRFIKVCEHSRGHLDAADGDILSFASNSGHPVDSWILDLACSIYVMSNGDWFDTYKSVNSGIVTMGKGAHFKITGIGNIRIKMFDGVVRTLFDVRHVPDVERIWFHWVL